MRWQIVLTQHKARHPTGAELFITIAAKQIVEAHGGTIIAESVGVGEGATFVVELPA